MTNTKVKWFDEETLKHLYETDYFYKVLQLAKLSEEIKQ